MKCVIRKDDEIFVGGAWHPLLEESEANRIAQQIPGARAVEIEERRYAGQSLVLTQEFEK